jgi:hypothetical protein
MDAHAAKAILTRIHSSYRKMCDAIFPGGLSHHVYSKAPGRSPCVTPPKQ